MTGTRPRLRTALVVLVAILAAQVAAQEKPADRKRLGKVGKCDICAVRVDADAKVYSSAEFKSVVRAGLRPPDEVFEPTTKLGISKAVAEAGWVKQVMADTTDWACCEKCAAKVEKHLAPRKDDGDEKAFKEFAALYEKGRAAQTAGRLEEAVELYERALALAPTAFGGDDLNAARLLNNTAMLYHTLGKYAKAEPLYKRSVTISEKAFGPDDPSVAKVLDNWGQLYVAMRRPKEAAPIFERSLKIREKKLPGTHVDLAISLNNLANAYELLGRHADAEPLYARGLKIVEQANGPDDLAVALVLDNSAGLYRETGRYAEAVNNLKRALTIRERKLSADDPLVTRTLHQLAEAYIGQAEYALAASTLKRAMEIDLKRSGPENPDIAASLAALGALHHELGEELQAADYFRRELKLLEGRLGRDHPEVLESVHRLGTTCIRLGEYAEAESHFQRCLKAGQAAEPDGLQVAEFLSALGLLYRHTGEYAQSEAMSKKALTIREQRLGRDHPHVALSLNNLAVLYETTGQYAQAEALLRRSLKISEEQKDVTHVASTLNSLGMLYNQLRLDDQAEPLLLRALKLKEERLGRDHPGVAITLDNLAGVYLRRKRWSDATAVLERALKIRETKLAPDHPAVAVTLHGLGVVALEVDNSDRAAKYFERSLKISQARLGEDHPTVGGTLNYLAHAEMQRRRYGEAERHLLRTLAIRETKLPKHHPEVVMTWNYLGDFYAITNQWEKAIDATDRSQRGNRAFSSRILPSLSEPEQLAFLGGYGARDNLDKALYIGLARSTDPRARALSAEWLLNGKGGTHEALTGRLTTARDARGVNGDTVRELLDARRRLATLTMQMPTGDGVAHGRQLVELTTLERQLSAKVGRSSGEDRDKPWVELSAVRTAVPPDAVLVEVSRVRVVDYERARVSESARYAAWVIPAAGKGEVRIIDLGEADRIERAVAAVRRAFHDAPAAVDARGRRAAAREASEPLKALAEFVLRPLEPHIGGTPNWLLSPDADLWLVPWAALPLADGSFAVEKHRISCLISGRDLVSGGPKAENNGSVVMADPDFDLGLAEASKELQQVLGKNEADSRLSLRSGEVRGSWPRLPGTGREASAIGPRLARFGDAPDIYTDRRALEGVFKTLRRPRVLVLSTHGFFLEDQDYANANAPLGGRGVFIAPSRKPAQGEAATAPPRKQSPIENPLLRCGLVLAGANSRGDANSTLDDGLLTGLEIVGTDLRGTDLVVLSACETGVGQVRNSEGVAGLRQAFQLAGARTVVSTLWKIPDSETADLMTAYFENLSAGWSKADALRRSQLALIRAERDRHGDAHPFFWAGFTLTGDPGFGRTEDVSNSSPPSQSEPAEAAQVPRSWPLWAVLIFGGCLVAIAGYCLLGRRMRNACLTKQAVNDFAERTQTGASPRPESSRAAPTAPTHSTSIDGHVVKVVCTCGARLRFKSVSAGKRVKCPRCGELLVGIANNTVKP